MRWGLRALTEALALALLVALDARDVWFKLRWVGPDARAAFPAELRAELAPATAPATANASAEAPDAAGWRAFLGACAGLAPLRGGRFQHVLASDCVLSGRRGEPDAELAARLVLTADARADAMAWAACRLLRAHRRPPTCHEPLVAGFLRRHQLAAPHVPPAAVAAVMSPAEGELLALLAVVGASAPLSAVVCVSGLELPAGDASASDASDTRALAPRLFGCGSPNAPLSAFVGRAAPAFAALQADKAWLAASDVRALGMSLRVRQSAEVSYAVADRGGAFALEARAAVRLRCSGALFDLMLAADVALLAAHAWSALELARVLRQPPALQPEPETASALAARLCFLGRSLARSRPAAALSLLASLLSWPLLPPAAAALRLAHSPTAALHVYLTALRLWTLLLAALNAAWDLTVLLDEARAYRIASRTFVASWELAAIALAAFHLLRGRLSWPGLDLARRHLLSNAYADEDDTPALWAVYSGLAELLLLSLAATAALLVVRYALDKRLSGASGAAADTAPGYARLSIEELLDVPIRAKSLVRFGGGLGGARLALERCVGGERFLWAAQYLAHGVLVESKHFLGARRGFLHPLPAHLPADGRGVAQARDTDDEERDGSPKRRRYVSPLRH